MSDQQQLDALKGAAATVVASATAATPGAVTAAIATTLVAQATAVVTAANAVAIDPPVVVDPPPGQIAATRLTPTNPQTPFGAYGFYFSSACMMANGKIHHVWSGAVIEDGVVVSKNGTWELDTINKTATLVKSGPPNNPENMGCAYVPSENAVYRGDGGPDAGVPVVVSTRFDVALKTYASQPPSTQADAALLFDPVRSRLVSFGGWTPPSDTMRTRPLGGAWSTRTLGNAPVCLPETASGMTFLRSGLLANGTLGVFDNNREIKEWDGVADSYVTRPTTGPKPPRHSVGTIVGDTYMFFCGYDEPVWGAGIESSEVNVLYACPRSTWAWTRYTTPAAVTPRPASMLIPVADPERNRLVLMIAAGFVEAWAFVVPG